ncbi:hypothetical protein BH24ACT23_BH24ACT23_07160 [soil metagenome]
MGLRLRGSAPADSDLALACGLAAGRLAIGAGLWLAPNLTLGALGFGKLDPNAMALARIAATRDLALGAWMIDARHDRERLGRAAIAVAACDAGDTIAFALLARGGGQSKFAGLRGVAAAGPATAAGAFLATRLLGRS